MAESIYIHGKWIKPVSGKQLAVINPADGLPITEIDYGGREETTAAIEAAHSAFPDWSRKTVYQRADRLRSVADQIRKETDRLAEIMTKEVGKPLPESKGEIAGAADQFEWYAEEVKRASGDVIPNRLDNRRHMTIRHPVGPVAAIAPWNFPLLLSARKLAPALAAGCTVVCRPASQAPLTVIELFRLMDAVGFPPGVANLICGAPSECTRVFVEDDRIRKISFTGSLSVGQSIHTACAARMKKVSLELGGHAPFIVLPDFSPEEAAEMAVFSKFRNMGQVCISPSRFFVPEKNRVAFEQAVVARVARLRLGNGLEPFIDVGPLFEEKRVSMTQQLVDDIVKKGGEILSGGKPPEGKQYKKGCFYEPTVATGITGEMLIMQEEPFAPILPIIGYDTVARVIQMANETPYGLAAYALTRRLDWAIQMAESLEAGLIGINDCAPAAAQGPFGGMKASGTGREGWRQGLESYYETKYISIGL